MISKAPAVLSVSTILVAPPLNNTFPAMLALPSISTASRFVVPSTSKSPVMNAVAAVSTPDTLMSSTSK